MVDLRERGVQFLSPGMSFELFYLGFGCGFGPCLVDMDREGGICKCQRLLSSRRCRVRRHWGSGEVFGCKGRSGGWGCLVCGKFKVV